MQSRLRERMRRRISTPHPPSFAMSLFCPGRTIGEPAFGSKYVVTVAITPSAPLMVAMDCRTCPLPLR